MNDSKNEHLDYRELQREAENLIKDAELLKKIASLEQSNHDLYEQLKSIPTVVTPNSTRKSYKLLTDMFAASEIEKKIKENKEEIIRILKLKNY